MSNKRTSLPLWKKYDIVDEVNRRNDIPLSMLAKELLEISRTSLITILNNKENIEDFEASCRSKTKRKRKHNFEAVDLGEMVSSSKRRKNSSQWGNLAVESSRVCRSLRL